MTVTHQQATELAVNNLSLAYWAVKQYNRHKTDVHQEEELNSHALLGLWKAALTYKPDHLVKGKPVKFSTYAVRCIMQELFNCYRRTNHHNKLTNFKATSNERTRSGWMRVKGYASMDAFDKADHFAHIERADLLERSISALTPEEVALAQSVAEQGLEPTARQVGMSFHHLRKKMDAIRYKALVATVN